MQLSDFYPVIVTVVSIALVICAVRVFFTLWEPIERRVNGDRLKLGKHVEFNELKKKPVDVHLKSGGTLGGVQLLGYGSTHSEAPYDFRQLLMVVLPDQRRAYIRIGEIEYFEEVTGP